MTLGQRIMALLGKGQMGSTLLGSLQICLFDRGTFWVLPLTYLYITKSARAYLFPQSVKFHYFCSGPMSVDPFVRNRHCTPELTAGERPFESASEVPSESPLEK